MGIRSSVLHYLRRRSSKKDFKKILRKNGDCFKNHPLICGGLYDIKDIKAACIMDEFSFSLFSNEMRLVPVDFERWFEPFEEGVNLFLVESFWRGSGGSWKSVAYNYNYKERELLRKIVRWCRSAGIPTIFWNKEDPVHFDEFVDLAIEFDYIFTTDAGCVEKYKALGKDARVLMFAAQPSIHNPIEAFDERKDHVCFAGSWIPLYPERTADFERIADAIADYGLDIYDRNLNRGDPRYAYPEKYQGMIKGTLKGDEILQAYKGYRFGLNMNSVKDSETMLARRVFELMACNTPVLSNDSLALRTLFGDLAICTDDAELLRNKLDALRSNPLAYRRLRQKAMREVMLHHTLPDRVGQIAEALGIPFRSKYRKVVCLVKDHRELDLLQKDLDAQSYRDFTIAILDDIVPNDMWKDAISNEALIIRLYPEDHHGPNFLLDLVIAFFYSPAEMVTRLCHYDCSGIKNEGRQFRWTDEVVSSSLMIDPSKVPIEEAMGLWDSSAPRTERKCLSIDEFNFIRNGAFQSPVNDVDI